MTQKTWLITGASRGFGREWTIAALERGDRVAATARDTATLDDLVEKYGDAVLALQLDVTDREADFVAVARAHEHFGRLDVVVNNAGYGQFGFVEELSEQEFRDQMETNVFGAMWVTQAALPFLRAQGSGHLLQVSSIGGISAFTNVGAYHASKWALEGFSQALAQEVADFGIHVTLVEPGGFATDWAGPSARHATPLAAYDEVREKAAQWRAQAQRRRPGRPDRLGRGRAADRRRRRAAAACLPGHRAARHRQGRLRVAARDLGGVAGQRGARSGLRRGTPSLSDDSMSCILTSRHIALFRVRLALLPRVAQAAARWVEHTLDLNEETA
ncbi:SDR family NAD(P)-dependent oxidoreductase [Nocardioides lijunqiniae]|uniref:SDR family NAD(P)-dependent oxidoreductase n=1 Tax=Nocardioides lijunqiniae TaxID=2760832 RepID=UPI001D0CA490|nr:SDR family NAD(P)-dependent oxidoreductase [Nocardioides lijunqiniae]